MSNNTNYSEEESLKRSHSVSSNLKLTLICILMSLSLTLFVASFATIGMTFLPSYVTIIAMIVSAGLTALSFFLISRFKR